MLPAKYGGNMSKRRRFVIKDDRNSQPSGAITARTCDRHRVTRLNATVSLIASVAIVLGPLLAASENAFSDLITSAARSIGVESKLIIADVKDRNSIRAQLYVIDGDTIHYNREKIRIANIDTPEITHAKCDAELKKGLDAKAALKGLIDGEFFRIDRGDPKTGRLTDRYGRTLALISVNGRDVGEILIERKLARRWTGRRHPWC